MPAPIRITDRDKGYRQLIREVRKSGYLAIVGILGDKATIPKRPSRGAKKDSPAPKATIGDVAAWNEFGTDRIPARSFIGAWFDANRSKNIATARELALKRLTGKIGYVQSLQRMAAIAVGGIQKRIAAGIAPPNADSTKKRKRSSKPLIDTGQLRSSIASKILTDRSYLVQR